MTALTALVVALHATIPNLVPSAAGVSSAPAQWVSPRMFGAKADGITDDSRAFQGAVDEATARRVTLLVDEGVYLIRNIFVRAPLTVRGVDRDRVILKLAPLPKRDPSPIFDVQSGGFAVSDVTFDGNRDGHAADGFSDAWANPSEGGLGRSYRCALRIYAPGRLLTGVIAERCRFRNCFGAGLAARDCSHVVFRNNLGEWNNFETVYVSASDPAQQPLDGHEIIDNAIYQTGTGDQHVNANGILISNAADSVISSNYIQDVERNGIKIEAGHRLVIALNRVVHNTRDSFAGIQIQGSGREILLLGNRIIDCGAGIHLNRTRDGAFEAVRVIGNYISHTTGPTTGDGLALGGSPPSSGIVITGNEFSDVKRYAIYAEGGGRGFTISANSFASGPNGMGMAILIARPAEWSRFVVENNAFVGYGSAGTVLSSPEPSVGIDRVIIRGNLFSGQRFQSLSAADLLSEHLLNGPPTSLSRQSAQNWSSNVMIPNVPHARY